jgi:hypothetical protein
VTYGSRCCLPKKIASIYKHNEHIYAFLATFPLLYVCEAAATFFGQLSSPLLSFANDEIVQLQKLSKIWWANDQELMRNLTSLLAAPTVFFYVLTIFIYAHCVYDAFMLQVLDQMMIDMFLRPLPPILLLLLVLWYMAVAAACQKIVSIYMLFWPPFLSSIFGKQ